MWLILELVDNILLAGEKVDCVSKSEMNSIAIFSCWSNISIFKTPVSVEQYEGIVEHGRMYAEKPIGCLCSKRQTCDSVPTEKCAAADDANRARMNVAVRPLSAALSRLITYESQALSVDEVIN